MARYRKIDVRVWTDDKFTDLSAPPPNAQTLWFYLLTSPDTTNVPGLFRAGEAGLAEALSWPVEGFREAFGEVSEKEMAKADWKARVVWVPKAIHYNTPESPNVVRSWRAAWDEIPECGLKVAAYQHLKAFLEGLGEAFAKAFAEGCSPPRYERRTSTPRHPSPNQEQEQEQEQERPFVPVAGDAEAAVLIPDLIQKPQKLPPPEGPSPQDLVALWNEAAHPNLPRVTMLSPSRKTHAGARLRDHPDEDFWRALIARVNRSPHLRGENNRGWRADFDWVLNPNNMAKILDGNYDRAN